MQIIAMNAVQHLKYATGCNFAVKRTNNVENQHYIYKASPSFLESFKFQFNLNFVWKRQACFFLPALFVFHCFIAVVSSLSKVYLFCASFPRRACQFSQRSMGAFIIPSTRPRNVCYTVTTVQGGTLTYE